MSTNTAETILTKEDIEEAIKNLKNRKFPDPDGIYNEMLKHGSESLVEQPTTQVI